MAKYRVRVSTGEAFGAGTWDKMSITIVGTQGETPRLPLDHLGKEFTVGAEEDFEVKSPQDVGPVLLLRVHKAPPALLLLLGPLAPDAWFCRSFQLTPPRGSPLRFPAYQWLEGAGSLVLREGAAKVSWADHHPKLQQQRREELQARQEMYRWKTYQPGWPHCLDMETVKDLDLNTKYSVVKSTNLYLRAQSAFAQLKIKGLLDRKGSWRSLSEMEMVLNFQKTPATGDKSGSRRTSYEALVVVRRGWWPQQSSDSRDGVDRWTCPQDGESVGCDEKRKRGPQALPQQPEYVFEHWQEDAFFASQFLNGLNPVLIHRCRRLPENFPVTDAMVAPVLGPGTSLQAELELLVPHTRYTLHINTLARELLITPKRVVDRSTGLGLRGFSELIQRSMEQLNYSVLCLPEDIRARGVEDIPGYYYRDDGMQIWGAVEHFVSEIIGIYYPSDVSVRDDSELQAWVWEIFSKGFLGRESSGLPSSLETREALVQYVTMVIFNCSAKHSAVGSGQFDYCAWMPNLPPSMQLPPPTSKGQASLEGFIATLPPVNASCDVIIALWLLSKEPGDQRPLGTYPEEHFTEEASRQSIAAFQSHLAQISQDIRVRNQGLVLPYTYLDPPLIESSISI
ncbi:polyunsaturated fatty acid lipoxygenase ALOX15B isoform X3 [Equus asinus]|uniref:polyunsaturated fatty acid lipoxygenase ALOX15B isoform X3 n=1 Tax=Equus asinus TaxID=9793 RepID=UPI0038F5E710